MLCQMIPNKSQTNPSIHWQTQVKELIVKLVTFVICV